MGKAKLRPLWLQNPWRCENVGGLGEHVTCHMFRIRSRSFFLNFWATVGWIKVKLGMGVRLGPGHILLGGDPAYALPQKGHSQFSAHVCFGETAGWIKMPLGTEVHYIRNYLKWPK